MFFLKPFISLILNVLSLYYWAVMLWTSVSWLSQLRIINLHNPVVKNIMYNLSAIIEPILSKIRKLIPTRFANMDLSVLVLLLAISFIKNAVLALSNI